DGGDHDVAHDETGERHAGTGFATLFLFDLGLGDVAADHGGQRGDEGEQSEDAADEAGDGEAGGGRRLHLGQRRGRCADGGGGGRRGEHGGDGLPGVLTGRPAQVG